MRNSGYVADYDYG